MGPYAEATEAVQGFASQRQAVTGDPNLQTEWPSFTVAPLSACCMLPYGILSALLRRTFVLAKSCKHHAWQNTGQAATVQVALGCISCGD